MRVLFFILYTISFIQIRAQININAFSATDSLDNKSYEDLYKEFKNNSKNKKLTSLYAPYYLNRAKLDKDTLNIVRGFYLEALNEGKETNSKYLDSIIYHSKNLKHPFFPWIAYRIKSRYFFNRRLFKESIDNQVFALEYAKENNHKKRENISKFSIGLLKERIGRNKEALKIFKECYLYRKKEIEEKKNYDINELKFYLNTAAQLSDSYRRNGFLDLSSNMNSWMQQFSKKEKLIKYVNRTRLIESEIHLERGNYSAAIDSVNKSFSTLLDNSDNKNIAFAYYIKGFAKDKLGDTSEAIVNLKKMDSIFDILQDLHPELRPGYEILVNYYKKEKNLKSQLHYTEKLIKFDSIIHTNYTYLSEAITKKFDTTELIEEKDILKKSLKDSKIIFWIWIGIILFSISVISIIIYKKYQKILLQKKIEQSALEEKYKQKFDLLLQEHNSQEIPTNTSHIQTNKSKPKELDIADNVVKDILNKLENFESIKGFKNVNITASSLAKEFGTNQNYLGRIIKFYMNKSFRVYINDMRLDYTLEKLRNDKSFRNYTISAIANESGYSNAEPFSKAFKTKVGIYPSEFISKLNN